MVHILNTCHFCPSMQYCELEDPELKKLFKEFDKHSPLKLIK